VDHRPGDVAAGLVGGLLGGLAGAAVMSAAHAWLLRAGLLEPPSPRERDEDATVTVAEALSRTLLGRPLPDHARARAGSAVHHGFGAALGLLYGAVTALVPRAAAGAGLGFGAAVWLGAHAVVVPALGLAPPPRRRPARTEGAELVLHLAYGASVEMVRRATVALTRAGEAASGHAAE
jgi:uncharacterized membrane protein YagU involved in acid resistance